MKKYAYAVVFIECLCLGAASFICSANSNSTAERTGRAGTQVPRTAPLFDFHSNFWVNLHQTLFHEALLRAGKPDRRLQSDVPLSAPAMSDEDKAKWNAAIDFYAKEFQGRQELFDDELVKINKALAEQPDDSADLDAPDLLQGSIILQTAAPIYRKYWWPAHNKSNEEWIASQAANVKTLGPTIATAMQNDLHQRWPGAPLRVDVCYYVAEIGHAYTTDGPPPHTTFSSSGTQLQGLDGFETLFHEASHSFADTMSNALFAQCGAQKKDCGQLWHAVLFYTAGVEVRRALPPAQQANFTPYAYKYGLYERGDWLRFRRVLETDWQAYLDGKMTFPAAIRAMVADLQ